MADVRILLTDKTIARLPAPKDGWYLARDTELKGFFVVVGKRKRTFTVQGDLRQRGKRASSIRVAIGDASEISTRAARATAKDYLAQISRGRHSKANSSARQWVSQQPLREMLPPVPEGSPSGKPGNDTGTPTWSGRAGANVPSKAIGIMSSASSRNGSIRRCKNLV
jgi:hypothetical protein